jgi:hypothetical protein
VKHEGRTKSVRKSAAGGSFDGFGEQGFSAGLPHLDPETVLGDILVQFDSNPLQRRPNGLECKPRHDIPSNPAMLQESSPQIFVANLAFVHQSRELIEETIGIPSLNL